MKYSQQFERYLAAFRDRLLKLVVLRGVAAVSIAALIVSLLAVAAAVRAGFPDDFMITARLVLVMILGGIAWYFFALLKGRVAEHAAAEIEQRTPVFDGRVEAYLDTRDAHNPMRELLAEESLQLAANHAPEQQVTPREFRVAWSAAGAAVAILLLIAIAGPGNYELWGPRPVGRLGVSGTVAAAEY